MRCDSISRYFIDFIKHFFELLYLVTMRTTHIAATTSDASGTTMYSKEEPRDHVMNEPVKGATDRAETLVYVQSWRIHPIKIKIDYTPKEVAV